MMNYSKRSDGRRLLLAIALFGILSTYGISTANVQVTNADAASTEESAAATTAGDQSTVGGLTPEAAGGETTSEAEKVTGVSVGETATQSGGSLAGGTSDEQTGSTEGGSSITEGEGTVEAATSDGKFSTAEEVSSVRTGGGEAGVESSAGRTEGGTTATVKEAPSSAGSTETEKQITEIGVIAGVTGAPSTNGTEEAPLGAIQQDGTTGTATAEESTTSVVQTSIAADAQYTTNMGDTSAERHTETPVPVKVTVIAVSSTLAPIGCNSTSTCETPETLQINNRLSFNLSICEAEAGVSNTFLYCVTIELHDQRNRSVPRTYTKGSPHKVNGSTVLDPINGTISTINNKIRSRTTTTPPVPPAERKRRQADYNLVWNDADIDELWETARIVVDNVTCASGENSSPALQSSPQSTETLAESSTASGTTSVLDAHRGCRSTGTCDTCGMIARNSHRQWLITGSICEAENGYCVSFVIQDQRNPVQREKPPQFRPHKHPNCSAMLDKYEDKLGKSKNSTYSRLSTKTPTGTVGPERKRRQANEATASPPRIVIVDDDFDIDDLFNILDEVINEAMNSSSENSSPPSTETLPIAKDDPTKGDPKAVKEPTQTPGQDVWSAHRGIFLTVAILISVCVVVTAFCCLCMKWRERGGSRNPEKHPIAMEEAREAPTAVSNPITDREMIQDEAPMQERENPAVTPNGGGQHISKADEDNGWVVPLDELSNAEKEKPEVENTRL